jgi:hypothetical protein
MRLRRTNILESQLISNETIEETCERARQLNKIKS